MTELRPSAQFLINKEEVLAVEWLAKRSIFGIHADINEMAKFKSKMKKDEDITGVKTENPEDIKKREEKAKRE